MAQVAELMEHHIVNDLLGKEGHSDVDGDLSISTAPAPAALEPFRIHLRGGDSRERGHPLIAPSDDPGSPPYKLPVPLGEPVHPLLAGALSQLLLHPGPLLEQERLNGLGSHALGRPGNNPLLPHAQIPGSAACPAPVHSSGPVRL